MAVFHRIHKIRSNDRFGEWRILRAAKIRLSAYVETLSPREGGAAPPRGGRVPQRFSPGVWTERGCDGPLRSGRKYPVLGRSPYWDAQKPSGPSPRVPAPSIPPYASAPPDRELRTLLAGHPVPA